MPKKSPAIVGIDTSLTNTSMFFGPGEFREIKGGKLRGVSRLHNLYAKSLEALRHYKPRMAVIEGYAYMANARQHRLGEAGGMVRLACFKSGVDRIYEVPPTTLKKFFAGHGKATKEDMIYEASQRGHVLPNDNVADACALWYAGQDPSLLRKKCETEAF